MLWIRFIAVCLSILWPAWAHAEEPRFLDKPLSRWTADLNDPRPAARRDAAFALGKFGADAIHVVPKLLPLLSDQEASVREAAANAIGDIGPTTHDRVVSALAAALQKDGDAKVRRGAAVALGHYGERAGSACSALQQALRDRAAFLGKHLRFEPPATEVLDAIRLPERDREFYRQERAYLLGATNRR